MDDAQNLIERLYDAFNRRDPDEIRALCDDEMEFYAVTGEEVGRSDPYTGVEGLHDYLEDVATVWEELLITISEIDREGSSLLVRGRVYLRSRAHGIRDMPVAWIWKVRGDRLVRGQAFPDPEEGVRAFRREAQTGQSPDPGASRSMSPHR
jgi:ketosteroid isomerase-like protein